jgi:hypothetical protein
MHLCARRGEPGKYRFAGSITFFLCFLFGGRAVSPAEITGPLRVSSNPNYFKDANGTTMILGGSQTWNTFQDWGTHGSIEPCAGFEMDCWLKIKDHSGVFRY